jgi:hypothetical protein
MAEILFQAVVPATFEYVFQDRFPSFEYTVQYLTQLFNAILIHGYFLAQWKVAQMILIPHPGKSPHALSSYRLQSLTQYIQSLWEALLIRLLPLVEHGKLLPTHQFVFRPRHSTIEQTHHLIRGINNALDNKQYCSAAFLDISEAFDKVWHTGILYKLRWSLPLNYFLILNSYLSNRHFIVKVNTELTDLTLSTQGYPKAASSADFCTSYTQPTFQLHLTPSQPILPMTLHSSPQTVILPLLPRNCKPPSSQSNPG